MQQMAELAQQGHIDDIPTLPEPDAFGYGEVSAISAYQHKIQSYASPIPALRPHPFLTSGSNNSQEDEDELDLDLDGESEEGVSDDEADMTGGGLYDGGY